MEQGFKRFWEDCRSSLDKSRGSSRRGIQAKEIHNFVVKRSASKGQDEGNHFLKGKLPVPGIVFAGSCGEDANFARTV